METCTEWTDITECSQLICGNGFVVMQRTCKMDDPVFVDWNFVRNETKTDTCLIAECPDEGLLHCLFFWVGSLACSISAESLFKV